MCATSWSNDQGERRREKPMSLNTDKLNGLPMSPFAPATGYAADLQPTISLRELNNAVMNECSCGGGGPDDKHTCPACQVYHRLVTLRHNAEAH